MAVIEKNGFMFFEKSNFRDEAIIIIEKYLDDAIVYINQYNIQYISIRNNGFSKEYTDEIFPMEKLKQINSDILDFDIDYKNITINNNISFDKLERFRLADCNVEALDFNCFQNLKRLGCNWSGNFKNLESCFKLEAMGFDKYKSKEKNLYEIGKHLNLNFLSFVHGNLATLEGIENFPKLETLELSYQRNLIFIKDLGKIKDSLIGLNIEGARNIKDYESVAKLKNLKYLRFDKCGEIESLDFINDMPNLEAITFYKTNIKDGNMLPLLKLKRCWYDSKRHYSHRYEKMEKMLEEK